MATYRTKLVYAVIWDHRFGMDARVILSDRPNLAIADIMDHLSDLQCDDYEGPGRTDNEEPREDESIELIGPMSPIIWEDIKDA